MFVAARLDDDFSVDSGAVYVFTRDGSGNWTELATPFDTPTKRLCDIGCALG